jgi:hypothetical protein
MLYLFENMSMRLLDPADTGNSFSEMLLIHLTSQHSISFPLLEIQEALIDSHVRNIQRSKKSRSISCFFRGLQILLESYSRPGLRLSLRLCDFNFLAGVLLREDLLVLLFRLTIPASDSFQICTILPFSLRIYSAFRLQ